MKHQQISTKLQQSLTNINKINKLQQFSANFNNPKSFLKSKYEMRNCDFTLYSYLINKLMKTSANLNKFQQTPTNINKLQQTAAIYLLILQLTNFGYLRLKLNELKIT